MKNLRSSLAFNFRLNCTLTVYNVVLSLVLKFWIIRGCETPSKICSSSRNHRSVPGKSLSRKMHVAWNSWSISNVLFWRSLFFILISGSCGGPKQLINENYWKLLLKTLKLLKRINGKKIYQFLLLYLLVHFHFL